ncbi:MULTISPECIES: hypothetical protein [Planococcaceae]|uniref:hypothetical protein n=1 Tax=Caryophanaceae TaxID=186818 RepID=UPI00131498FC|nr:MULTISPECIES: hypothetical protein [Planococcaceae]QHJ72293.1 hypothetical protein DNR44_017530 [Planococcus halotolerans]
MMGDGMITVFPIIGLLLSLLPIVIAIYVVIMWVNLTKERNAYLKQIAEELRRR